MPTKMLQFVRCRLFLDLAQWLLIFPLIASIIQFKLSHNYHWLRNWQPLRFQSQNLTMFGYDTNLGKCVPFEYSGCDGNENLFLDLEQCSRTCQNLTKNVSDPCAVNEFAGNSTLCNSSLEMHWIFSFKSQKCVKSQGCHEEHNQFKSQEDCQKTCVNKTQLEVPKNHSSAINVNFLIADCFLAPKAGTCSKSESRFYFNSEQKDCLEFHFSGCGGNKNNFESQEECLDSCGDALGEIAGKNASVCMQSKDSGSCHNAFQRWFFNTRTETCQKFIYTGCGGNTNR